MNLREAIRQIVLDTVGEDLKKIVREVLVEELTGSPSKAPATSRSEAARKAAVTRRANAAAGKLPEAARKIGLAVGQRWDSKSGPSRAIEIRAIDAKGVSPRVLHPANGRTKAKHMSFEHLNKSYHRREAPAQSGRPRDDGSD